ncbi:RagB/SusD family nutrient uptake outer membrane protein [Hymenobacter amundsenii]|uniref:RagB/SusD family nutrient uptake outer membrane protein n=1 Tax=Hymenobacter amundsenii TaxID=2006685 RepID=A0A246FFY2_9BACT|nr:RagB/SusD family nutrient uptake outer membrane protein [Hymenobacter amundsenii]OWP61431.1 RagB/SusD family nutrient uptake outer membrane protein [Hymenobacter amundsenii]
MKKILYQAAVAALLSTSLLTACNKKLDVDPVDNIDASTALATSADVEAAMVGAYTGIQNVDAYGGYFQLTSDLLADNGDIAFVGTFIPPNQFQRKVILRDNGFVQTMWLNAYNTVNRVNSVLGAIDRLDTPGKQARIEGEAKFVRSLLYFDLVRLFGKAWNDGNPQSNPGVPLVLTPTTVISAASQVSRNTVAEVYTQVIADLTTAENLLPGSNGFFANKYAAAALLARVYLQQGNYPAAAAAANRALQVPGGALVPSYADEFTSNNDLLGNTSEDLFAIQVTAQSGRNELNTFYSASRRGDVEIQKQLLDQFEKGDTRAKLFRTLSGVVYTTKYDVLYGNIKLLRLAEMYLTRAEANFRAGTSVGASPLSDINRIRERAGLPALTTLTLPAVLKERKLELLFEGFSLHDLKRTQGSTSPPNMPTEVIPFSSNQLVLPIPLREINANPNLVQNPGY